jgi:hypothetical protein
MTPGYRDVSQSYSVTGATDEFGNALAPYTIMPESGLQTGGWAWEQRAPGPSDTVARLLAPQEYVVNERASIRNAPVLEYINDGGDVALIDAPRFGRSTASEPGPGAGTSAIDAAGGTVIHLHIEGVKDERLLAERLARIIDDINRKRGSRIYQAGNPRRA